MNLPEGNLFYLALRNHPSHRNRWPTAGRRPIDILPDGTRLGLEDMVAAGMRAALCLAKAESAVPPGLRALVEQAWNEGGRTY